MPAWASQTPWPQSSSAGRAILILRKRLQARVHRVGALRSKMTHTVRTDQEHQLFKPFLLVRR